jgi:hypothetical protein
MDFYEKMNFPEQQLEIMRKMAFTQTNGPAVVCFLWVIVLLAFLLYTKRYFILNTERQ